MTRGVHPTKTLLSRFWEKVEVQPDGCWRWTGSINRYGSGAGYGAKWDGEKVISAHRWSYLHFVGPIPDGMQIDHACHTRDESCLGGPGCPHRACVNPEHLEPVTPLENAQRGRAGLVNGSRGKAVTHCPQNHPYDEENTYWRPDGRGRNCRTCTYERNKATRLARQAAKAALTS